MLGRVNPQGSLLNPSQIFGHLVSSERSFYGKLAAHGQDIISDDDFEGLYSKGRGRPSIPPSVMMRGLLLATKDGTSDRESSRRSRVDLDWKAALGLDADHPGIGATTFSLFRARIVLHDADQALFEKTVRKAAALGLFSKKVTAIIDSSPVLGAGAVQDTYQLVQAAIRKVVEAAEQESLSKKIRRSVRRYMSGYKPKIDWSSRTQRQKELVRMVTAANGLLKAVEDRTDAELVQAAKLLAAIVAQDVEIDDQTGEPTIRKGVAKDRIVSVSDPEMRHGRKSSSTRFDGHKMHVVEDEATEMVLAVDIGPANESDSEKAVPLLEQIKHQGAVEVGELIGDMAYGGGDIRDGIESAGVKMVAKVPPAPNGAYFPKTDFKIDPAVPSATCPAGVTTTNSEASRDRKGRSVVVLKFEAATCGSCALRARCVKATGGRNIMLNFHEAILLKARIQQSRANFKTKFRRRAVIERKIDHLQDLGAKKARYRGHRKTRMQILLAASVANFGRLHALGALGGKDLALAG